jgi:uncharacterized membrane protein YesL
MERYRLKDFFKDATDIVAVNFLFLLAVILSSGILFGAAFKALFAVTFKIMGHQDATRIWKDFWTAFIDSFWFSTLVWLISVVFGLMFAFVIDYGLNHQMIWLAASGIVSAIFLILYLLYFFPMLSIFKTKSRIQMLKNAAIMGASHPFSSLLLAGGLVMVLILFEWWTGTLLFSIGLMSVINAAHLNRLFYPYLEPFKDQQNNEQI